MIDHSAAPELMIGTPGDSVRLLRLDRPEKRNALPTPLLGMIAEALREAARDEEIRCVAMRKAKALMAAAFETQHTKHLAFERQAFSALFGSTNRAEGIASFTEKRTPAWTGH